MVHLNLEPCSDSALHITGELADRFKSKVSGVAAGLPNAVTHADGMIASSVLEADYEHLNQAFARCESHFRSALKGVGSSLEWRSDAGYPADLLVMETRAADLLIVGRKIYAAVSPHQPLDIGDAVMKAGRPIRMASPHQFGLESHFDCLEGYRRSTKGDLGSASVDPMKRLLSRSCPMRVREKPQGNMSLT